MPGFAGGQEEPEETCGTVSVSRPGRQSGYNPSISFAGYRRLGHATRGCFNLIPFTFIVCYRCCCAPFLRNLDFNCEHTGIGKSLMRPMTLIRIF